MHIRIKKFASKFRFSNAYTRTHIQEKIYKISALILNRYFHRLSLIMNAIRIIWIIECLWDKLILRQVIFKTQFINSSLLTLLFTNRCFVSGGDVFTGGENFSYNFSELLYNFITLLHFLYELEHFLENLHRFSQNFSYFHVIYINFEIS